jgi:hypothetical protein
LAQRCFGRRPLPLLYLTSGSQKQGVHTINRRPGERERRASYARPGAKACRALRSQVPGSSAGVL